MPEPIRINFRNFSSLDFGSAQRCQLPRASAPRFGEDTLLRGGIATLSAAGNNKGRLLANSLERIEGGAALSVGGAVPGARLSSPRDWTLAEGLTGGVGAGLGYSLGGGIYLWAKNPGIELGLFGSFSAGLITNIGASAGVQVAYLFGPAPAVLAGDSITVAVTVDAVAFSVGGVMFLSAPPGGVTPPAGSGTSLSAWLATLASTMSYTPQVIGVGFQMTVGFSVLPIDMSIMPGRTWTTSVIST